MEDTDYLLIYNPHYLNVHLIVTIEHHYTTQYEESAECIRLDVNAAPTILQTNRIDGGVKVDDVRWRLVASHHEFKDCDDDFWKNPR